MNNLFHGTIYLFENPKIPEKWKSSDFGNGFYATTIPAQAIDWAKKMLSKSDCAETGYVNIYSYNEKDFDSLNLKRFNKNNEDSLAEWFDFVYKNRNDLHFKHDYDITYGPVADNDIESIFQWYESSDDRQKSQTKKLAIERLLERSDKIIDQFCFHNEKALSVLKFIGRIQINPDDDPGKKIKEITSIKQKHNGHNLPKPSRKQILPSH